MRKLIISLIAVLAMFAMTASLASSRTTASAARAPALCGGLYKPPCRAPTVVTRSIVSCQQSGTILSFPITVHANAGLKKAVVHRAGRTIKTKTFPSGTTNASFSVTVNTHGFHAGLFTLSVTVTDQNKKTATKTAHFTICRPKPVFTG